MSSFPRRRPEILAHAARLVLLSLASVSCEDRGDSANPSGSTVTIAYSEDAVIGAFDSEPRFLVFLPLMARNERGELEGRLARSWERSADYREWTYHLRTDVRWHDGTPVTAHDVEFTLKLLTRPEVGEVASRAIESIIVVDDSTVTVRGGLPDYQTWTVYLPRHLLEDEDPSHFWDWEFWKRPVGNGPYRFVRYAPRTLMEFEANPDHYRGRPRIERVIVKLAAGSPISELLSGQVDASTEVGLASVVKLARDERFQVYYSPSPRRIQIYWNVRRALFSDPSVRHALTLAIDRRALHRALSFPDDLPLTDGLYSLRQFQRRQLSEPLAHNPQRAAELLSAAGWRLSEDGEIRARNGDEFHFTILVPAQALLTQDLLGAAVFIQDQLRRVGVAAEVQALENLAA